MRIYHFKTQLLKDLLSSHARYTLIRLWAPRFHMFLLDGFGNSDKIYSLYTGMPKGLPAATEPVSIVVAEGIVLKTTIDPLTKIHQVICDVCNKKIRLTKSAHPHGLFEHRKFCIISKNKRTSPLHLFFGSPILCNLMLEVEADVYQGHIHYQELLHHFLRCRPNLQFHLPQLLIQHPFPVVSKFQ